LTVTAKAAGAHGPGKKKNGQPKAPRTIAQNVTIVNTFFDWLSKEGVVARNPTRRNGERILARPALSDDHESDNIVTVSLEDVAELRAAASQTTTTWSRATRVSVVTVIGTTG
jgi:hypothetical protein